MKSMNRHTAAFGSSHRPKTQLIQSGELASNIFHSAVNRTSLESSNDGSWEIRSRWKVREAPADYNWAIQQ